MLLSQAYNNANCSCILWDLSCGESTVSSSKSINRKSTNGIRWEFSDDRCNPESLDILQV